jgi:hypothetical protein
LVGEHAVVASGGGEDGEAPRFRVIEGGGQERVRENPGTAWAQIHFRTLCVEILRALARGDDRQYRVVRAFDDFLAEVSECGPLGDVVNPAISEMYEEIGPRGALSENQEELRAIIRSSLQVAAESLLPTGSLVVDAASGSPNWLTRFEITCGTKRNARAPTWRRCRQQGPKVGGP